MCDGTGESGRGQSRNKREGTNTLGKTETQDRINKKQSTEKKQTQNSTLSTSVRDFCSFKLQSATNNIQIPPAPASDRSVKAKQETKKTNECSGW